MRQPSHRAGLATVHVQHRGHRRRHPRFPVRARRRRGERLLDRADVREFVRNRRLRLLSDDHRIGPQPTARCDHGERPRLLERLGQRQPLHGPGGELSVTGCSGAPTVLAATQGGPVGLAADDNDLYWVDSYADGGALMKCDVGGCNGAPTQLWSGPANNPMSIVGDAINLYWTNVGGGSVMQCSKANCAATLITLATGRAVPNGIAVDSSNVYWREGNVYRCAIGGCNDAPTLVATASFNQFSWDTAIALDDQRVYWTQSSATPNDSRIMWAAK